MEDMPETVEAVEAVLRAVRERGVGLRLKGSVARLTLDDVNHERPWLYRSRSDLLADRRVRRQLPEGVLLLTDRMSAADAEDLRARGSWFADAVGRMYLRAPGALIDVAAPRTVTVQTPGAQARRTSNLMSASRAQVVFCLLAWPHVTRAPTRYLAEIAGVSSALAQQVVAALSAERYLTAGNERLLRAGELLDRWAAAFGSGLARRLELGSFAGEPSPQAWADGGNVVYLTGEAAVPDLLRGGDLTMYVREMDTRAVIASGWRRAEPDAPADIVVRRQFWTDPDAVNEVRPVQGQIRHAPVPLVYAELVASGESRQREVARELREQIVAVQAR